MRTERKPDLRAVFDLLAPKLRDVTISAHTALKAAGIRHALAGGLAVGAVVPVEALVCMKLLALRPRDRRDIEELVEAGLDVKAVRAYVAVHLPALVDELDRLSNA